MVVFKIDNAVAIMPLKTSPENIKDLKELYSLGKILWLLKFCTHIQ